MGKGKYMVPTWFYFGQALALGVERARVAGPTEGLTDHSVTEVGEGSAGRFALAPFYRVGGEVTKGPAWPPSPRAGDGATLPSREGGAVARGLAFFPLPGRELLLRESSH